MSMLFKGVRFGQTRVFMAIATDCISAAVIIRPKHVLLPNQFKLSIILRGSTNVHFGVTLLRQASSFNWLISYRRRVHVYATYLVTYRCACVGARARVGVWLR